MKISYPVCTPANFEVDLASIGFKRKSSKLLPVFLNVYFTEAISNLKLSGSFIARSARIFLSRPTPFSFKRWMN